MYIWLELLISCQCANKWLLKNKSIISKHVMEPWKYIIRKFWSSIFLKYFSHGYNQNPIDRWLEGCILSFPKNSDLGLAKNYRGITIISIAAKIYNAVLRNRIEPKIDNILRKNQKGFQRNRSTPSQISTTRRILEGVRGKKTTGDNSICRLYLDLWFHS